MAMGPPSTALINIVSTSKRESLNRLLSLLCVGMEWSGKGHQKISTSISSSVSVKKL